MAERAAPETSFPRRQRQLLREAGVAQIVFGVGHLRDAVEAAVRTWGLAVQRVVNPTPEISTRRAARRRLPSRWRRARR